MFSLCFAHITEHPGTDVQDPTRIAETLDTKIPASHKVELFIPAPATATKEEAFEWHLTTRNFFAYIFRKPLVGRQLGQALVNLEERIYAFCSSGNRRKNFLSYAGHQGYRDLVDCPDYALAMVYYAEHYKLRDIWIDAFAHCVGMNESLPTSAEYVVCTSNTPFESILTRLQSVSSLTKALIVRARLEMDIHLDRATAEIREFLLNDVSPSHLGLTDAARAHVDRFRSFLHGFYIEKFGYWPPPKGLTFPKVMFQSMYNDFKNLYEYLVDIESTADFSSQKPASGGICVLQNVESFDKRHKFPSLPHPLPLLPKEGYVKVRTQSQKSLRTLTLGSKQNKSDRYMATYAALTSATNRGDPAITTSSIVQAYQRFERQWAQNHGDEKVSMTEARKARWILIYGTLQYLISALRAPKEVRDNERPNYPLCCLVVEQSPWQLGTKALVSPRTPSTNAQESMSRNISVSGHHPSDSVIEPDCHREHYLTHTNTDATSRRASVEMPAPLKIPQLSRNLSGKSIKRLSFSSSRNSVQLKSPSHRYGNGLNEANTDCRRQTKSQPTSRRPSISKSIDLPTRVTDPVERVVSPKLEHPPHLQLDCNMPPAICRTPTFTSLQMDEISSNPSSAIGHSLSTASNSTTSTENPAWSDVASATSSSSSVQSQTDRNMKQTIPTVKKAPLMNSSLPREQKSAISSFMPITYGKFSFGFDTDRSASTDSNYKPHAVLTTTDPAIGVALSKSPTAVPPTSFPLITTQKSNESLRSLSAESLQSISFECNRVAAAVEAMSPLRSNAPAPDPPKHRHSRSIYSILSASSRISLPEKRVMNKMEVTANFNGTTPAAAKSSHAPSPAVPRLRDDFRLKSVPYSAVKPNTPPKPAPKQRAKISTLEKVKNFWRR